MAQKDELLRILREEFGITSEQELDDAIRNQGFINLAPFCEPVWAGEEKSELHTKKEAGNASEDGER